MVGYFSSGRRRLSRALPLAREYQEEKLFKWEKEEEKEKKEEEW